jgi:hypothetical protein
MAPETKVILSIVQDSLTAVGVSYEQIVEEFGQVRAWEVRESGGHFTVRDHIRGLVLALLSAQRPWGPIARNIRSIEKIFLDYDKEKLIKTLPSYFVSEMSKIRCGNRRIVRQMNSLAKNIETFDKIDTEFGTLDIFVTSGSPNDIAKRLSEPGKYKLEEIGYPLSIEYLRNVGIPASKPDMHIRRLLSVQRLGYFKGRPSEMEAYNKMGEMAKEINCCPTYLDNLLWMFCAQDYGNICGANPRCHFCGFAKAKLCNYPSSIN